MLEPAQPARCHQCNAPLGDRSVTLGEEAASTIAESSWTVCSWACARELVVRMIRSARDDR